MVGGYDLRLARNPTADEVWAAAERAGLAGRSEVVFTGLGEPTLRLPVLLELVRRLRAAGVRRVRLDTDGLASLRRGEDVPQRLAEAGLHAVSASLNPPETYARLCPSRYGAEVYPAVRAFIRRCVGLVPDVAASAVAPPGLSVQTCRAAAEALGARFRWRPYDRLGRVGGTGADPGRSNGGSRR